ncbi:MAG TPA: hypothetical protein VHL09_14510 [Dehalococcoidia bacterium]|nr:hypothetical protein [Dehalococcoidia bacterium]
MFTSIRQKVVRRPAILGAAGGLILVGAALGGAAYAQTPTPPDNPARSFVQRLAERLGIPEDRLTQAFEDTRDDMLTEAVAAGRLTQEQADRIRQHPGPGNFVIGPHGLGPHGPAILIKQGFEGIAGRLGLTPDELRSELEKGQSLAEIAQARGVDRATLVNLVVEEEKAVLAQAVADGKLTQAQADRLAERGQQMAERLVDRKPGLGARAIVERVLPAPAGALTEDEPTIIPLEVEAAQ